jgi:hypothetical protein
MTFAREHWNRTIQRKRAEIAVDWLYAPRDAVLWTWARMLYRTVKIWPVG